MRWLILLVLFATPAVADRSDRIHVIARVGPIPPNLGACGVIHVRADIQYLIVEVRLGKYPSREVIVDVSCPERIREGQVYRLTLEPIGRSRRYRVVREQRLRT